MGEKTVSIVRIGLAETKYFADGYDAIFSKKKTGTSKSAAKATVKKKAKPAKKKPKKK